ncbi:MAG: hypothetical protein KKC71_03770, partial [Chloroflexi bacterium]|nr:hypothetical protein [Chloroflexota bacterium]
EGLLGNDRGYVSFALNSGDFPLPTHAQHLLGRVLREGLLGGFTRNDKSDIVKLIKGRVLPQSAGR